jgi:hypothetical protein
LPSNARAKTNAAKPEKRRSDEAGVSGQWSDDDRDVYDGRPAIAARFERPILDSGSHAFPRSRAADYNRLVLEFLSRYQRPPTTKPSEMTSVTHTARESSHE